MGLFDKVTQLATGKFEKEGLESLREVLSDLNGMGITPIEREGARKALSLVVRTLQSRGVASKKTVDEAESMIRAFATGGGEQA